jgi:hypothetical protein
MGLVPDGGNAGGDRRAVDVERPADAVERIGHMRRAIGPSEPQRGKPVGLGERARHHDVAGARHQFDPGGVVVAPDILGIGRVEHQQAALGQAGPQALDLVEGQVACRSDCWGWRETPSWCAASRAPGSRRRLPSARARAQRRARRRWRGWRSGRPGSRGRYESPRRRGRDRRGPAAPAARRSRRRTRCGRHAARGARRWLRARPSRRRRDRGGACRRRRGTRRWPRGSGRARTRSTTA